MTIIVIKDLPESIALDRQAMLAITGGARWRASSPVLVRPAAQRARLFEISRSAPKSPVRTRS